MINSQDPATETQVMRIEADALFEAIMKRYGYDFRQYSEASRLRRVQEIVRKLQAESIGSLMHALLIDETLFRRFLSELTVTTSELFRDPGFFRMIKERVFPILRTFPSFKVWHAGCSTGEEVFSLLIFLNEAKLLDRATIYATDINPRALQEARSGIFLTERVKEAYRNYRVAGGERSLADYWTAESDYAIFDRALSANVSYYEHNLATDEVFAEVNLILCRNVLIYFNRDLQNRVLSLFERSLSRDGILTLGSKETLQFSSVAGKFTDLSEEHRIYQLKANSTNTDLVFAQ